MGAVLLDRSSRGLHFELTFEIFEISKEVSVYTEYDDREAGCEAGDVLGYTGARVSLALLVVTSPMNGTRSNFTNEW